MDIIFLDSRYSIFGHPTFDLRIPINRFLDIDIHCIIMDNQYYFVTSKYEEWLSKNGIMDILKQYDLWISKNKE